MTGIALSVMNLNSKIVEWEPNGIFQGSGIDLWNNIRDEPLMIWGDSRKSGGKNKQLLAWEKNSTTRKKLISQLARKKEHKNSLP